MMKAHGIHQGRETYTASTRFSDESEAPSQSPRKRKRNDSEEAQEYSGPPPGHRRVKEEGDIQTNDRAAVKTEPVATHGAGSTSNPAYEAPAAYPFMSQHPDIGNQGFAFADMSAVNGFEDFIHPSVFAPMHPHSGYVNGNPGPGEGGMSFPDEHAGSRLGGGQITQEQKEADRSVVLLDE